MNIVIKLIVKIMKKKYTLIFEDFSENELLVKREVNGNTKFAVYEIENVKDYLKV